MKIWRRGKISAPKVRSNKIFIQNTIQPKILRRIQGKWIKHFMAQQRVVQFIWVRFFNSLRLIFPQNRGSFIFQTHNWWCRFFLMLRVLFQWYISIIITALEQFTLDLCRWCIVFSSASKIKVWSYVNDIVLTWTFYIFVFKQETLVSRITLTCQEYYSCGCKHC